MLTTSYPRWAGDTSGNFIRDLVQHVCEAGDLDVVVLAPGHPKAALAEESESCKVHRLTYFLPRRLQQLAYGDGIPWNLRGSLAAWLNLPFLMLAFALAVIRYGRRSNIIHAHWGPLGALAILVRLFHRRPVVLTVHGTDLRANMGVIRWITRWAVRRADAVLTPSQEFHDELLRVRPNRDRCLFMPNGIALPTTEEIREQREARKSKEYPRIVTVGRLISERRHEMLIDILAGLQGAFPKASLTIVGGGRRFDALKQRAEERGVSDAVRLVGRVPPDNVPEYLLAADIYVSPTTIENFGTAVVEAAAHGLPVVITAVGFPAELVLDGESGRIVPPGDAEQLASALREMVEDCEKLEAAGRRMHERVREMQLAWPDVAKRILSVYRQLADGRE